MSPKGRRRLLLGLGVMGLAAIVAPVVLAPAPLLVWNASASAPRGLWQVMAAAPLAHGDFVLAALPEAMAALADRRGYLPSGVPLVKRVAGLEGDVICADGEQVTVNGAMVAARLAQDSRGRRLPAWAGCTILEADAVFLLMGEVAGSFDGRYFGPVERSRIIGRLVSLWTW